MTFAEVGVHQKWSSKQTNSQTLDITPSESQLALFKSRGSTNESHSIILVSIPRVLGAFGGVQSVFNSGDVGATCWKSSWTLRGGNVGEAQWPLRLEVEEIGRDWKDLVLFSSGFCSTWLLDLLKVFVFHTLICASQVLSQYLVAMHYWFSLCGE